jgi:SpoVK/Ycf46/Vps4 family AAA+-type ATPase
MVLVSIFSSLIAVVFSAIPSLLNDKLPALIAWLFHRKAEDEASVVIRYSSTYNERHGEWNSPEDESYNYHLIEAIKLRLKDECFSNTEMSLSRDAKSYENNFVEMLSRDILKTPNCQVDFKGIKIEFRTESSSSGGEDENEEGKTTVASRSRLERVNNVILTSREVKADKIHEFVESCYKSYVDANYKKYDSKDKILYYYTPESEPESSSSSFVTFNRYRLYTQKSLDDVFFPQKERVRRLLEPYCALTDEDTTILPKLSFLLYGPPGCGKTSMIKALANATQRSVISVRLSAIKNNEQLLNVFLNDNITFNSFSGGNKYSSGLRLPLRDRIYVLEDIDSDAPDVVKRRKKTKDTDYKKDFDEEDEEEQGSAAATTAAAAMAGVNPLVMQQLLAAQQAGPANKSGSSSDSSSSSSDKKSVWGTSAFSSFLQADKVTLSGLLNVLDGILELNEAILIMTSNTAHMIDPALLRPGRVTEKIFLTFMRRTEITQMLQHIFPDETWPPAEGSREAKAWAKVKGELCTPAETEGACRTAENRLNAIEALLEAEAKAERKRRRKAETEEAARQRAAQLTQSVAEANQAPVQVNLRFSQSTGGLGQPTVSLESSTLG